MVKGTESGRGRGRWRWTRETREVATGLKRELETEERA
jgi:hypothetical protein